MADATSTTAVPESTTPTVESVGVVDSYIDGVRPEGESSDSSVVGLVFVLGFMLLLAVLFVVVARRAHRASRGY